MIDLTLTSIVRTVTLCTLTVASAALPGCSERDGVTPPPVNAAIDHEAGPGDGEFVVACDGPDDELALLGDLCGRAAQINMRFLDLDGDDRGVGGHLASDRAHFLLFARTVDAPADQPLAAALEYSAYVLLDPDASASYDAALERWREAEAVTSGEVRTEAASSFDTCDGSWVGQGSFVWRETTITVRWQGYVSC